VTGWPVEYTDEFGAWWQTLTARRQDAEIAVVELLMEFGPGLGFPHSSAIAGARHRHLRELRIQSGGRPLRVFYAFAPRRTAILLTGRDKTGDDRFYRRFIRIADRLYDDHLDTLRREGLIDRKGLIESEGNGE
jgi:hypothetical protein